MANGGNSFPSRLWLGTDPGGLFLSNDEGSNFELVKSLWDHPSRKQYWMGGGRDQPGIHSIVVNPRNEEHVFIGISCADVFETTDSGKTWSVRNKGLRADFLPDPNADIGHDPHILVSAPTDPDTLWQQNHCGIFRSTDGGMSWKDISEAEGPARFGFGLAVADDTPE